MDSKAALPVHHSKRWRVLFTAVSAVVLLAVHLSTTRFPRTYRPLKAEYETLRPTPVVGEIVWAPCPRLDDVDVPPGIDCGSVIVPKDYFNASIGTASIAFARLNATKSPSKGSVFLNPGGPGGAGMAMILGARGLGRSLADAIGHDWDLIGFDPRGIGRTRPAAKCFSSDQEEMLFNANTIVEQGMTVPSIRNVSSESLKHDLVEQNRMFIVLKKSQAKLCAERLGDELRYMGTANVVRDMDFMSEVFDGQGAKINFWGGSYGSILGAYLVNMLPERIGYTVIDGIADPVNWSSEPSHKWPANWLSSTEKTYQMFLKDCSEAGPKRCPLARYRGEPPEFMMQRLEDFFDRLALSPLPTPDATRPSFLTSGAARGLLLIAFAFSQAMAGNGTLLANAILARRGSTERLAVTCADSPPLPPPTAEDLAEEQVRTMREVSEHFGASVGLGEPDGGCGYWYTREGGVPERFTGPWNASNLEIPMLIVSNTHDPITPVSSGLLVNSLMPESSVLLIQDGPGHCSVAMQSLCTLKTIRNYYAGILPENGTVCGVDNPTFPDPDSEMKEMQMSEEDRRLVEAGRRLEKAIFQARGW
ncbi:alpha/beta-hydrolase [Hymenopellis radicata]|nr:alpha/beta-hydrolase [Hymenopellis radicata]